MSKKPKLNPLEKAISIAGSQSELAKAVGRTQQSISLWLKYGKIPAESVIKIEAATGVSRHILRPDVFGVQK